MELTLEQRKQEYLEKVYEEYGAVKNKWWKSTKIYYHFSNKLAKDNYKRINKVGHVEFKKGKAGAWIGLAIFGGISILSFFIDRTIGVFVVFSVIIILAFILPRLLDNKIRIRITRNGIWTDAMQKEVSWEDVVLICFKEISDESSSFTLIIHYYDPGLDEFLKTETGLDEISVHQLSATIEVYKSEYIPTF